MKFEIIGELRAVEAIATGRQIRVLAQLRKKWGSGRWRKMKGVALVRLRTGRVREAEIHCTRLTASEDEISDQEDTEMSSHSPVHAVLCVANEGNEVSLQRWKIYKPLRDVVAQEEGLIRVIDESGEDYLFPEENFVPIELPEGARKPFERAVRTQRRDAAAPDRSLTAKSSGLRSQGKSPRRRSVGRA